MDVNQHVRYIQQNLYFSTNMVENEAYYQERINQEGSRGRATCASL